MTGPEMERAIEFLLESQASLSAKTEANTVAIAALTEHVDALTGKVDALTGKVDALAGSVEALAGVANTALEVATSTSETLREFIKAQGAAQARTDAQLARLGSLLEVHVSDGHGGHP
jgi:hypothetical protein